MPLPSSPPAVAFAPDDAADARAAAEASSKLVLASGSPRRRELLARAGIEFEIMPADIPEEARPDEAPAAMADRLAREKALAVAARLGGGARPVLAADTIVVCDGEVLGKPRDPGHAVELLSKLVGRSHVVITGVALAHTHARSTDDCESFHVSSSVRMRRADRDEIERYVAGGEPLDKAGAYAVQGEGRKFVEDVEGSETNVIGLPMEETLALLARAGVAARSS